MPHKRETQMVCNLHFPTGTTYFWIWNWRAFQERKSYQFPGRMKSSPYYCRRPGREPTTSRTPRLHNKQGVPHPTSSATGRNIPPMENKRTMRYDVMTPVSNEICGIVAKSFKIFLYKWRNISHSPEIQISWYINALPLSNPINIHLRVYHWFNEIIPSVPITIHT